MLNLNYLTLAYLKNYRRRLTVSWHINYGDCYRWALLAQELHGGQLISVTLMIEKPFHDFYDNLIPECSHAFVKIDGKYYDAEMVQGIDDWEQLKYFSRIDFSLYTNWEYELREHTSVRSFKRFWRPTLTTSRADRKLLRKIQHETSRSQRTTMDVRQL